MIVMAICVIGALWSLVQPRTGSDAAIRVHAWVIGAGFFVGLFGMAGRMFWGVAGLLVGVIIAFQLAFPELFLPGSWAGTELSAACARCTPAR
jgi:cytochrome c oxidase cbb3-type subunit 1